MKKDPKVALSRHATDPNDHKTTNPIGESTFLKDPCTIAAEQVEAALLRACQGKFNKMIHGCCCHLEQADQRLPHINTIADASLLNTASDGIGGVLPLHSPDNFWEASTSIAGPWSPAMVTDEATGGWLPGPIGGADWISLDGDGRPVINDGLAGDYYFRIRFILCDNIDPENFILTAGVLADDSVHQIYVNGIAQGGIPIVGYRKLVNVDIVNNWQICVNEIVFHVNSIQSWMGFLAQFSIRLLPVQEPCGDCDCKDFLLPALEPCFTVSWGDSTCDCLETNDCEVLYITACNCYSNVTFKHLTIHQIIVLDEFGNPVPNLPDGMPCVEVIPFGPICFDDLHPCVKGQPNCKSRQVVLRSCGAPGGKYQLKLSAVCFDICYSGSAETCFEFSLCKD